MKKMDSLRILAYYFICLMTIGIVELFVILVKGDEKMAINIGLFLCPIAIEIGNVYGHLKDF